MLSASARKSKLAGANKQSKGVPAAASTAAAAATRNLGRGGGLLSSDGAGRTLGRGSRLAAAPPGYPMSGCLNNGTTTSPSFIGASGGGAFPGAAMAPSSSNSGFPFPPSPSTAWWDPACVDPYSPSFMRSTAWDLSRDKDPRPPGEFMSYFGDRQHNFHLVGAPVQNHEEFSPAEVEIVDEQQAELVDSDGENLRTEKRLPWKEEEDVSLMSSWIEHSTDSTCGADRGGNQYWSAVVEHYNKSAPPQRKRNLKQSKDRWHKINRWTWLFECAYAKARRVFTSGYSDQMWIDAAHKFYVEDNKDAKLGPFVLTEVWKICRDVTKWKTYNEELRNARKRTSFHLEGDNEENNQTVDDMPKRPIGQKAAKKVALAGKKQSKQDDGNSKDSAIDVDKIDRFSKVQEEANANRIKVMEFQQKLLSEKIEATKLAHLTAQEYKEEKKLLLEAKKIEKESKMMDAYNSLISQDTSTMSDDEKAERVVAMKCLRKTLFPKTS